MFGYLIIEMGSDLSKEWNIIMAKNQVSNYYITPVDFMHSYTIYGIFSINRYTENVKSTFGINAILHFLF